MSTLMDKLGIYIPSERLSERGYAIIEWTGLGFKGILQDDNVTLWESNIYRDNPMRAEKDCLSHLRKSVKMKVKNKADGSEYVE